jgi:hypothetical protein
MKDSHKVAAISAIFAAGMSWGVFSYRIQDIEAELTNHKVFRERVIDALARIETKLDERTTHAR